MKFDARKIGVQELVSALGAGEYELRGAGAVSAVAKWADAQVRVYPDAATYSAGSSGRMSLEVLGSKEEKVSLEWRADRPVLVPPNEVLWNRPRLETLEKRFIISSGGSSHPWIHVDIVRGGESRSLSIPITVRAP